jgi:hypothetical protein
MPTGVDWFKQGDAEAALAKAATRIEAEYRCHYAYQAHERGRVGVGGRRCR